MIGICCGDFTVGPRRCRLASALRAIDGPTGPRLLLALSLVLVLFVSLTIIFLLRLVSADRRARRRPLRSGARPTVGQLEDDEKGVRQ